MTVDTSYSKPCMGVEPMTPALKVLALLPNRANKVSTVTVLGQRVS